MNPPPFLVLALPRSRTFWLSRFLAFGGWDCGHDQLRFMRGMEDVKAWLGTPCFGSVENHGCAVLAAREAAAPGPAPCHRATLARVGAG